MGDESLEVPTKQASQKVKSNNVFGQARRSARTFRAGLYARVSTNDQQTLAMQIGAMQEHATRAAGRSPCRSTRLVPAQPKRQAREPLLDAVSRGDRRGAGVAIGPLGPVSNRLVWSIARGFVALVSRFQIPSVTPTLVLTETTFLRLLCASGRF